MKTSETIGELSVALCKAQGELGHAVKAATNPHFKSRYADLQAIVDASRPILAKHGLAAIHGCESVDGKIVAVECRLIHTSGQWIETSLALQPTKADPQGIGSAITYGRRYTLASIVGIATEDDDGNAASVPAAPPVAQRATPNGTPNGVAGDAKRNFTLMVQQWTGLPMEDVPGAIKKIKSKCGIKTADSTPADVKAMTLWIEEQRKQGGDALVALG